jgi:DNA-binding NarL/FixJ family response regulator
VDAARNRPRVVVVDDHAVVRAGLRFLFERETPLDVCAETGTIEGALEAVRAHAPDLVVLDLTLGNQDGRALLERLHRGPNAPRVLVVSMHEERVWGRSVMAAGAHGFVAKSEAPATLLAAVAAVLNGRCWVGGRAVDDADAGNARRASADDLSRRELEILAGVAAGRSVKQIAAQLGVLPATVDSHKRNIRAKLRIDSTAELVVWAHAAHAVQARRARA